VSNTNSSPKKNKLKGNLLYALFLIVFVLVVGEIAVRLMGFSAWSPDRYSFKVEPGDSFFQPDPVLGYRGRPGPFKLTLSDQLTVQVTHDDEGYRISEPPRDSILVRPEIWFFGCSFTHGYGVNDDEAYPWLIQKALPQYTIRNFATDGYGTYHAYLQLEQLLKQGKTPAGVVLAYGGFHDQRNVNDRHWKKALSGRDIAEGIQFPYYRWTSEGKTEAGIESPAYSGWPLMRYSALVHYLESAFNRSESETMKPFEITKELIHKIHAMVEVKGAKFLVANIYQNQESTNMLNSLDEKIERMDISVDLEDESLRILPNDGHPNAKGHQSMADKLMEWFNLSFSSSLPAQPPL